MVTSTQLPFQYSGYINYAGRSIILLDWYNSSVSLFSSSVSLFNPSVSQFQFSFSETICDMLEVYNLRIEVQFACDIHLQLQKLYNYYKYSFTHKNKISKNL